MKVKHRRRGKSSEADCAQGFALCHSLKWKSGKVEQWNGGWSDRHAGRMIGHEQVKTTLALPHLKVMLERLVPLLLINLLWTLHISAVAI
jgi:hypothetical protein